MLGIGGNVLGHPCGLPSTFHGNPVDSLLTDMHPRSQNRCRYAVPIAALVLGKTGMGHFAPLAKQAVFLIDPEFTDLCGRLQVGQNEQQLQ